MGLSVIIACSLGYVSLLFLIAWWVDKRANRGQSLVSNPYVYALSLAVYCTAWTFFGSVGRAASGGLIFLGVYLGPTLLAPVWYMLLHKMILISKHQRITSIADFVSSRYGKSTSLGVIVTLFIVLGIVPYISIQLRAVTFGINTMTHFGQDAVHTGPTPVWLDAGFWVAIAMAIFAVIFGARKLDPNERHEGMVAAIAFESIVKLLAFIIVGFFVTFSLFDGFEDVFQKALNQPNTSDLLTFQTSNVSPFSWNMLVILSLLAIILLPRQFHVSVVENISTRHIAKAMWVFPLYLLLINIFVLPIALAGKMLFDNSIHPDTYVLSLPLANGAKSLALLAFVGGFSAATGMIIVEATALSIMFSNHILVPLLIRTRLFGYRKDLVDGASRLLDIRRISMLFMLLLAYWYQKSLSNAQDLVSVGLISFTAVAQLAPAVIGGIYWQRATKQGALAGMLCGFIIWAYCLPLPGLAQGGIISDAFIHKGLFGIGWLKPYALFNIGGMDTISHGAFWSLLFNTWIYAIVSINTKPSMLNLTQADLFVNIHKYIGGHERDVVPRQAKISDLRTILNQFLGEWRAEALFREFEAQSNTSLKGAQTAKADLINFAETSLAGAVGAASARLVIERVTKEEPVTMEEVMRILQQTREALEYSRLMEEKNAELEDLTRQLTEVNEQLRHLDRLKADFITTVTHELRTPVTSIKSLSKIMLDYYGDLDETRRKEYLQILVSESDRIGRLVTQVLDIEKIESGAGPAVFAPIDLVALVRDVTKGMKQQCIDRNISCEMQAPDDDIYISGDRDKVVQVIVNLLSNALKFAPDNNGMVRLILKKENTEALIQVTDNGPGIPKDALDMIFERFTQVHSPTLGKPHGSGLGLFITRMIVQQHGGRIHVNSAPGEGAVFKVWLPLADNR